MKSETTALLQKIIDSGAISEEKAAELKERLNVLEGQVDKMTTTQRMRTGAYAAISALFCKSSDHVHVDTKNDVAMNVIDMITWGIRAETMALVINGEIDVKDSDNMLGLYEYANGKSNEYREYIRNIVMSLSDDIVKRENEPVN